MDDGGGRARYSEKHTQMRELPVPAAMGRVGMGKAKGNEKTRPKPW